MKGLIEKRASARFFFAPEFCVNLGYVRSLEDSHPVRFRHALGAADDCYRSVARIGHAGARRADIAIRRRARVQQYPLSSPWCADDGAGDPEYRAEPRHTGADLPLPRVRRRAVRAAWHARARARLSIHGIRHLLPAAVFPAWRHQPHEPFRASC